METMYSNNHKIVLQTFINEGFLSENKAKDLVIKLFNDDQISVIVNQINQQLQPLNMLIRQTQCEFTGQVYWVLISTVLDEVTRFQTEFSKVQLSFLRTIFSEIITSNNSCIQSTACLNLCSSSDIKLSKTDAEEFLNDMVKRKWLAYKEGYYYVGLRSITELMPYFRATYKGNLSTCCLCKQVIFHGKKCDNCETFFHLYCLKRYIMIHNPMKCLNCDTVISDIDLSDVIEDSTQTDDNVSELKVSGKRISRSKH